MMPTGRSALRSPTILPLIAVSVDGRVLSASGPSVRRDVIGEASRRFAKNRQHGNRASSSIDLRRSFGT
jgi:hypothetical protein